MKRWQLTQPNKLLLDESPAIPVEQGQIKVKLERALISYTDYTIYKGILAVPKYPLTLGRQGVGVVSEAADSKFIKGQRVVIEPYIKCNNCLFCKTDRSDTCQYMKILGVDTDGFFCDFINVPAVNVHVIPEHLSYEKALFADYVSIALNIVDSLDINKGEHVAILSANKLGYILAQIVSYYQAIPIVIDTNDECLDCVSNVNVDYVFNSQSVNVAREVFNITGGRMCEKVVYPTNTSVKIKDALDICTSCGKLCIAGVIPEADEADLSVIFAKRLTINTVNNGCGNYKSAINLLATDAVVVNQLYTGGCSFNILDKYIETCDLSTRYCCHVISY